MALLALAGILTGAADEERMIEVLQDLPGGSAMVWVVIAGIAGYVLWRAIEVITDPYEFGSDWQGIGVRTGIGLSALGYAVIGWGAAMVLLGDSQPGDQQQEELVGAVFGWPGGRWLVGLAGLGVIGVGVSQFVLLARQSYCIEINVEDRSPGVRKLIHGLAWAGYSARGVILGVLGWLLLHAALRRDPTQAGDTDTAFDFLGGGTVGDSLFLVVALGTIAYGLFMYANATWYQFHPERSRRSHARS
jgi:hypothetical protein